MPVKLYSRISKTNQYWSGYAAMEKLTNARRAIQQREDSLMPVVLYSKEKTHRCPSSYTAKKKLTNARRAIQQREDSPITVKLWSKEWPTQNKLDQSILVRLCSDGKTHQYSPGCVAMESLPVPVRPCSKGKTHQYSSGYVAMEKLIYTRWAMLKSKNSPILLGLCSTRKTHQYSSCRVEMGKLTKIRRDVQQSRVTICTHENPLTHL